MKFRIIWPIACFIAAIVMALNGLRAEEQILRWGFVAAAIVLIGSGLYVRFSKRWRED
jgi:hypothetical protein